jgi:hypothetical protein
MANEFIPVSEMTSARRGRKRIVDVELLDTLAELAAQPEGTAVVLRETFGSVEKEKRAAIRSRILSHWSELNDPRSLSIKFSDPEGIPQVYTVSV